MLGILLPPTQIWPEVDVYYSINEKSETRNRLDWRWVNEDFQPIYRTRAKFIRNFKTEYLTPDAYIWGEYFFYLNDHSHISSSGISNFWSLGFRYAIHIGYRF